MFRIRKIFCCIHIDTRYFLLFLLLGDKLDRILFAGYDYQLVLYADLAAFKALSSVPCLRWSGLSAGQTPLLDDECQIIAFSIEATLEHPEILLRHIAVIMDGNGRWAKARGLSRSEGHRAGTKAVRSIIRACREMGLEYLTLYTFSKENWGRPTSEIRFLFDLLVNFLRSELPELLEQDIRLLVAGQVEDLPLAARKTLQHAIAKTSACKSLTVMLALNYSGRDEIVRACRRLVVSGIPAEDITEAHITANLFTAGCPDPDLVIRTSGEQRISNFLLYQSAYSEFYFTPTLWPDFTPEELRKAIAEFAGRNRRFGKTGEHQA